MPSKQPHQTDFLVIGSGIAGLFFALKAARLGQVTVLAKGRANTTATAMAQGGIASVTSEEDTFDDHVNDTLTAGAGLCREDVVRLAVQEAPERIRDLINYGVQFNRTLDQSFDLTKEGGHSQRRILHSFDQTGLAIQTGLLQACAKNPNITILENQMAIDLILDHKIAHHRIGPTQCLGAYVLDTTEKNQINAFTGRCTVLATGGAGKVYLYTSNWDGATGDGIAMARRAGARVANMEFLQFHPTCLYHPHARNFLITEALRGEGGELVLSNGEKFMGKYHPMGSLAPRDIVARAIDAEIKKSGEDCVYLDVTHKPADEVRRRFPGVHERCLKFGIDITKQPIPVVPAAHYLCGGILTDSFGRTDIARLFALGETACTGLHGANRLASNSLMEATVFAHKAAQHIAENPKDYPVLDLPVHAWDTRGAVHPDEMIAVSHNWDEIRRLMWNYVGIVRSTKRLERAKHRIKVLQEEIKEYYVNYTVNRDLLELRNIALIAELIVESALRRKESRGIHYTIDFPQARPEFQRDTIL